MEPKRLIVGLTTVLLIVLPLLYQLNANHQSLMRLLRESQVKVDTIHQQTLLELQEIKTDGQ